MGVKMNDLVVTFKKIKDRDNEYLVAFKNISFPDNIIISIELNINNIIKLLKFIDMLQRNYHTMNIKSKLDNYDLETTPQFDNIMKFCPF
jgi:hypothetical protein